MDQGTLLKRVVFASLIGATVEWYDFFLYGVVAGIVFNQLYFPVGDPVISTLLAYTTFAVGFVTRPLGGVIFGHFGDRIGRKSMLILTLMIMGIATFMIGLVPTYAQIGVWAPANALPSISSSPAIGESNRISMPTARGPRASSLSA